MTPEQIQRIQDSFAAVGPRGDEIVDRFYARLFETAPAVREMFPADMAQQKKKLLASIALVVNSLPRFGELEGKLKEMGARHVGYGTQEAHYPVVRDTLIAVLGEVAGDAWTQQLEQDWTEALNLVAGAMIEGARECENKRAA